MGMFFFYSSASDSMTGKIMVLIAACAILGPPIVNIGRYDVFKFIIGSVLQVFFTPLYVNIFSVYSVANLHDVSWGNRDSDDKNSEDTRKNLEIFRTSTLMIFLFINIVYAYFIVVSNMEGNFITILAWVISINILMKIVISTLESISLWCSQRNRLKRVVNENFIHTVENAPTVHADDAHFVENMADIDPAEAVAQTKTSRVRFGKEVNEDEEDP